MVACPFVPKQILLPKEVIFREQIQNLFLPVRGDPAGFRTALADDGDPMGL